ncbi:MAG: Uma2 family endonuclease [Planctomycetota bacterium]
MSAPTTFTRPADHGGAAPAVPPPLRNGDRLTADEFHRRYEAMPDLKKAELIDGRVYVGSPLRYRSHGYPHALIITWLGTYAATRPGIEVGDNPTVRLDADNTPQPDAVLRFDGESSRSKVAADDYLDGPPELVVEIAASSVSYDLHEKADVYRRHGVREYVVWRVEDEAIDWLANRQGRFEPLQAADGVIESESFPGLRLDTTAALRGDIAGVLDAVGKRAD